MHAQSKCIRMDYKIMLKYHTFNNCKASVCSCACHSSLMSSSLAKLSIKDYNKVNTIIVEMATTIK